MPRTSFLEILGELLKVREVKIAWHNNSHMCVFQIAADVRTAKRELKKARTVLQMDKLKCRKRVLRRLGFASPSDVIEMKGRVACEISR